MYDVLSRIARSDRSLLAPSLACFALAGAANTALAFSARSVAAVGLAVAGVYALARYARAVDRPSLARASMGLWVAFLGIALLQVAAELVAAPVAVPAEAAAVVRQAAIWTTLLGACTSTAFLAFREYGAATGADNPEERVLDQDLDL